MCEQLSLYKLMYIHYGITLEAVNFKHIFLTLSNGRHNKT